MKRLFYLVGWQAPFDFIGEDYISFFGPLDEEAIEQVRTNLMEKHKVPNLSFRFFLKLDTESDE